MPTRNVNLTEELDQSIRARVASGRYENASEVVRAALRVLDEREAREAHYLQYLRQEAGAGFAAVDRGEGISGSVQDIMGAIDADTSARIAK